MRAERRALALALAVVALPVLLTGCRQPRQAMYDQPRYEPYESARLWDNGTMARPFPDGTVARGRHDDDRVYLTGQLATGDFAPTIPERIPVDREVLRRGQERFDIFCSPCHGALGFGNGMIVQRGYTQPTSYHQQRLRAMPDGYFFDVITRGFGQMPSYASQVPVEDRWAIVAYVRALQLSQNAQLAALPEELQATAREALAAAVLPAPGDVPEATGATEELVPDTQDDPPAPAVEEYGPPAGEEEVLEEIQEDGDER